MIDYLLFKHVALKNTIVKDKQKQLQNGEYT